MELQVPSGGMQAHQMSPASDTPLSGRTRRSEGKGIDKIINKVRIKNEYVRIVLSEFLGTAMLLFIGCGANAQATLHADDAGKSFWGSIVSPHIGWGLGITAGIWICGTVSGGHINPAVSLACAVYKKISWRQLPFYFIGQYLGAFFGALLVYCAYYSTLHNYTMDCLAGQNPPGLYTGLITSGSCATAGIFGTFPDAGISTGQAFVDLMLAAGAFILLIFAITDKHNGNIPTWLYAFFVGLCVNALITGYGMNAGGALNPARDLSPRILTAIAGWGGEPFTANNYHFWVPPIATSLGAVLGGGLYYICVGLHLPEASGDEFDVMMDRKKSFLQALPRITTNV